LVVVVCALVGAIAGVLLYRMQPSGWESMNALGVLACASLGASGGCLWADVG
jgi:hypothetical protein